MGRRLPRRKNQMRPARRRQNAGVSSSAQIEGAPVFEDVAFAKAGLELAERQAGYGAWFWNLLTDSFYMTPNACAVLGVEEGVTAFDDILAAIHEEDREEVSTRVHAHGDACEA